MKTPTHWHSVPAPKFNFEDFGKEYTKQKVDPNASLPWKHKHIVADSFGSRKFKYMSKYSQDQQRYFGVD